MSLLIIMSSLITYIDRVCSLNSTLRVANLRRWLLTAGQSL